MLQLLHRRQGGEGLKGTRTKALWGGWWKIVCMWALETLGTQQSHCWLALCSAHSTCFGRHVRRVSGNDDQNGHKKALSCSANNYLCRHAPSLTKTQSFLPPWAFTYGYWWTLFFFCFLPVWVSPALSVSRLYNLQATLITTLRYSDVTLWF